MAATLYNMNSTLNYLLVDMQIIILGMSRSINNLQPRTVVIKNEIKNFNYL